MKPKPKKPARTKDAGTPIKKLPTSIRSLGAILLGKAIAAKPKPR